MRIILLSFICVGWLAQTCNSQSSILEPEPIRDISNILNLGDAAHDCQIDITGIVTFADRHWDQVFVQDNGKAIFVMGKFPDDIKLGDKVRVVGISQKGDLSPWIRPKSISKIESGVAPEPFKIEISKLEIGNHDCRYVAAEGTVLQAVSSQGHTLLYCEDEGVGFHVNLIGTKPVEELWSWIDTRMKIVGALGVTVEPGKEGIAGIGLREIRLPRIFSSIEPKPISSLQGHLQKSDLGEGEDEAFIIQGQISACFPEFFVLSYGEDAKRIDCHKTYAFGISKIVRVAGKNRLSPTGELVAEASVIEALFSTKLPAPYEFQELATGDQLWKYVKVVGQPKGIELVDDKIRFRVVRDDQIANVELLGIGYPNLEALKNTRQLEVRGVVSKLLPDGTCEVKVNTAADIILLEASVPFWKYLAWILLPLSGLFLIGFVWLKIQRNRADSRAASIKAMNMRLNSTYQAISDGLLAIDNCGQILTVNPEFCEFVGRKMEPGEKFDVQSCKEFLTKVRHPKQVEEFVFGDSANKPSQNSIQVEMLGREIRSFDLCSSEIVTHQGEMTGKLLMLRDRTSERKLQAELIYSNKIEAVGQLVGGIAHDFNNILTTISANLSLLAIESAEDSKVLEKVGDAEVATNRGTELVRRLLSYSGKTELNPAPQSINAIIKEVHQFAKATFDARYRFTFELANSEPFANVDSGALEQVILNLYLNARDAMPNGGNITTQTHLISDNGIDQVCIRVTDSGPGIPEEIRSKIFNPFFTTKPGQAGTGLGLSTARRLIEDHNGELKFETTPGDGSCFVVQLPVTIAVENSSVVENIVHGPEDFRDFAPHQNGSTKKQTVLAVDDEDSIRKICSVILDLHGFEVLTAANGEAGLLLLETEWQRVDLILLDLTMPGISGLDFYEVSSVDYPDIPVILCSGYMASVPMDLANNCPKLPKPYSAGELVKAVRDALRVKVESKLS